jgi:hypothetical protein
MRGFITIFLLGFSAGAVSQDKSESRELIGKVGTRSALLVLHASQRADGSWQVAGEYVILATLARRFVEGERSPELGVTILKEGATPILFGRPGIGELRGIWRDGVFKGARYGTGGQRREEFEFSEDFPSMENYSAKVRCETKEGRYQSRLSLSVEQGKLKNLEWRSVEPGGQACTVQATAQEPLRGGLRFVTGDCRVTLRDLGEFVALSVENCTAQCGAEAYLEPLLVDRRGNCELLRHGAR